MPTDWLVRPAQTTDKEGVERCLSASYSELLQNDYPPEVLERTLPLMTTARSELLECPTWYVVVHPDTNEIVGCGGWTRHAPNEPNNNDQLCPHLRHFATDPRYARQGIGRALWQRCWEGICEMGAQTRIEAFSTLTAVPFYESLGFRKVKKMEVCLGCGSDPVDFPSVLMERRPG